jgi:hypothetical protein
MDLDRIRENARKASIECLLDRVTVYRAEMEGPALEIFESELSARGLGRAEVEAHEARREQGGLLRHPDGTVVRCSFCPRPASEYRQKWHRLWGWFLPLFPKTFSCCKEHLEELPTDAYGRALHHEGDD